MARPRKPTNVLEFTGAFKKNPARGRERANEPKPTAAADSTAPDWMNETEVKCWDWIRIRCAPGVLANSDEGALELAAELRALVITRKADSKDRTLLKALYTELGMTPASRSKVHVPSANTDKPVNEFAAI